MVFWWSPGQWVTDQKNVSVGLCWVMRVRKNGKMDFKKPEWNGSKALSIQDFLRQKIVEIVAS